MYNPQPLVSIIIPVYNGSDYLCEAIDSALTQTYKNIEIIVVNDGSTDNTEEIALSYGERIQYFKKENGGVSSALNLGIREMRGAYFSWLSHDDVYVPEKVEKQVKMLEEYGDEKLIAYCDYSHIDANSNPMKSIRKSIPTPNKIISPKEALHFLLKEGSFHGCALLIPKVVFEVSGIFNEDLRYSQDILKWYTFCLKGFSFVVHPDELVKGRIHQKQQTQLHSDRFYADELKIADTVLSEFEILSTEKDDFTYEYLNRSLQYGNDIVSKRCIDLLKQNHRFNAKRKLHTLGMKLYGKVRPSIRKLYYLFFRKIKTE